MTDLLYRTLKEYFGYDSFRQCQKEIIESILSKRDTMAIMPTGAGKSLCYQLPAIIGDGVSIVISPLISLMKDQVDYLESIGVSAAFLNSTLTGSEFRQRLAGIYQNRYKIIYVAPERLETEGFLHAITSDCVVCNQVIIDEAHCVSRWGHDFRPSYTRIKEFLNQFERRPVTAAFTATATMEVRKDIIESLGLKKPKQFITGFDRSNLEFRVVRNAKKEEYIEEFLKQNRGESGIIYTAKRKDAEKLGKMFAAKGFSCGVYHAGLTENQRNASQDAFLYDNIDVMIATNAFGMGIDKSNVRFVIHYNMPKDMESYYQEAGRAGRDGEPSVCILLYSPQDTVIQKFFIDEAGLSPKRKAYEYKKLQIMENYCHTSVCLRKYMLEYFGDFTVASNCGNCSVCNDQSERKDITLETQMILSCIYRSGQRFGRGMVTDILRGSRNQKILSFHLDQLNTYGLLKEVPKKDVDLMINKLIADGMILKTEEKYPVLKLTEQSIPVLKGEEKVAISIEKKARKETDGGLFLRLKELRKIIADSEGYPPYVIFHDATLRELAALKPETEEELAKIKGIGEKKKEKYGEKVLDVIKKYKQVNPEEGQRQKEEEKKQKSEPEKRTDGNRKKRSYEISQEMYGIGLSVEEIASQRNMGEEAVKNHLLTAYMEGKELILTL